jgi:hypothetical protein
LVLIWLGFDRVIERDSVVIADIILTAPLVVFLIFNGLISIWHYVIKICNLFNLWIVSRERKIYEKDEKIKN